MAFKITIENTGNFIRDSIFISVFNVLGYVTPFVVYSSISQKFGTSDLGKYLYILAFHEFFNVLLDIGIMYTGAKEISESNEDKKRISTFRTVFFTKLLIYFIYIVLIAFSVLGEILFKIEILKYDNSFYFFGCFYLLGQLLLGEWFYKGNNKNKLFSILIFLDKLIFLSIFLLLFGKIGNVVVFFAIYSIVHLLIGVFSFLNISRNIRSFDIKFRDFLNWVRSGFFFQFLKKTKYNLGINLISSFFFSGHVILLGYFVEDSFIEIYSIVYRLMIMIIGVLSSFSNVFYSLALMMSKDTMKVKKISIEAFIVNLMVHFLSFLTFWLLSPYIYEIVFRVDNLTEFSFGNFIMLLAVPVLGINSFMSAFFISRGKEKNVFNVFFQTAVLYIFYVVIFVGNKNSLIYTNVFFYSIVTMLFYMVFFISKYGKHIFKKGKE